MGYHRDECGRQGGEPCTCRAEYGDIDSVAGRVADLADAIFRVGDYASPAERDALRYLRRAQGDVEQAIAILMRGDDGA